MEDLRQLFQHVLRRLRGFDGSAEQFSGLFTESVELLDLSDDDVARQLNASRPTASRWRRGRSVPTEHLRREIASFLAGLIERRIARFEKREAACGGYTKHVPT